MEVLEESTLGLTLDKLLYFVVTKGNIKNSSFSLPSLSNFFFLFQRLILETIGEFTTVEVTALEVTTM